MTEEIITKKLINENRKRLLGFNPPIEEQENVNKLESLLTPILVGAFIFAIWILFSIFCTKAHADIPKDLAVKAIIGEAENQKYKGMLAIACCLRNRNTLKGVYGLHSPRVIKHKYSNQTLLLANKAWEESRYLDITNKATGWGNNKDVIEFKRQGWFKNCKVTAIINQHIFYKES